GHSRGPGAFRGLPATCDRGRLRGRAGLRLAALSPLRGRGRARRPATATPAGHARRGRVASMNPIHLVAHSDDWVSGRLHGWRPPRWIQVWMVASTRLGDGWVWLVMVVLAPSRAPLAETLVAMVAVNTAQVALKHA